jgi:hypothetical protein
MLTTFNEFGKDLATFEACFLFLITKVYNWVAKRNLNLVAALDFLILTPIWKDGGEGERKRGELGEEREKCEKEGRLFRNGIRYQNEDETKRCDGL